jgi:hypothetical protein
VRLAGTPRWRITQVDRAGRMEMDEIVAALGGQTALVTIMHSNNETGVLQPRPGCRRSRPSADHPADGGVPAGPSGSVTSGLARA